MVSRQMSELSRRAGDSPPMRDVTEHRHTAERAAATLDAPAGVTVEPAEGVSGSEWVMPAGAGSGSTMLYFHSGGYVAGSPRLARQFVGDLVQATGTRVLVAGYRLAPEHPYPAALDDAFGAYRVLLRDTAPERLAVAGASAGGGLALATMLRARGEGLPLPAAAFLLSPWADLTLPAAMSARGSADPLNSVDYLRRLASHYRAGTPADNPLVSPVLGDLGGLPPLHIEVGGPERLLDDALRLAARLAHAGGSVSLNVVDGALHAFPHTAFATPEARAATERIAHHLRTHLGAP